MDKENKVNSQQKQEKLPVKWEIGTVAIHIIFSDNGGNEEDLCNNVRQMLLATYMGQVEKAG